MPKGGWNRGIKHTEEHKENIKKGMRRFCDNPENSKKRSEWCKGRVFSEETKKKISLSSKINALKKWQDIDYRKLQSKSHKGLLAGEKHPNWMGGLSYEPYTTDWTKSLKISIRERDRYTCQLCGERQNDRAFDVHHINYDKKNCNPENLITLCVRCHRKTNFNREYWKTILENIKRS